MCTRNPSFLPAICWWVFVFTLSPCNFSLHSSHIRFFFSLCCFRMQNNSKKSHGVCFFSLYFSIYIVCCWVCVIRLWARCDKLIQTKLFSSCHIEISFIVSYFSSGTPLMLTCMSDRVFFSILIPSLFRNGFSLSPSFLVLSFTHFFSSTSK